MFKPGAKSKFMGLYVSGVSGVSGSARRDTEGGVDLMQFVASYAQAVCFEASYTHASLMTSLVQRVEMEAFALDLRSRKPDSPPPHDQ